MLKETPKEAFKDFFLYCYNLEMKNSRIVTHVKTNYDNKFEYFFMVIVCAIILLIFVILIFDLMTNPLKYCVGSYIYEKYVIIHV